MAYPIPAGSTLEIQVVGRLDGQTTRNVFHYWYPTGGAAIIDGAASAQALLQQFADDVYTVMVDLQSNLWTLQYMQAQWILPIRYRAIQVVAAELAVSPGGLIVGASMPANVSACVSLYCQKAGKPFQGRKFIPGIAASRVAASKLDVTGFGFLEAMALAFKEDIDDGATAVLVPVLLKKGTAPTTDKVVMFAEARDTVRCARRRTVGRGE